jgi:hypothetical protein
MTDQESAPPFFLKDARYVVGGATTLKDRTVSLNWFTEKTGALAVANA